MTESERKLWRCLRMRGLRFRFRRQHPVGAYVLDFYCPEARLCVEVDGEFHAMRADRDQIRDDWLLDQGIATLRIPSWDVVEHLDNVTDTIYRACAERCSG